MKSKLNPYEELIAYGEIIVLYPDGTCDIKFKKDDCNEWIIGFNYIKELSKRDVNKYMITSGTMIKWCRKTYVFLNKKHKYDYFKVMKRKSFTGDELNRINKEAERLAKLFKDR